MDKLAGQCDKAFMRMICVVAISVGLAGCSGKEVCGGSDAKYYDEGLIVQLTKATVPYRRTPQSGLCVDEKDASRLGAAERELEKYYPQLAHNPKDACEEQALVEWAQKEKLRYDLRPAVDAAGRPSGKLFFLRSFTPEELASNREKLEKSAPVGATCRK